ncbi:MAG: hypothetical protein WBW84_10970 [Acidobacteriaceae bacterium]
MALFWALWLGPGLHAQNALVSEVAASSSGLAAVTLAPPRADRPALPGMTVVDWNLLGAAAAFRTLDYQTTVKALSDPAVFHEAELPQALVDNHPGFAAFEVSTVVVNYWIYRELVRHGHRRLARAGQLINLGAIGGTVASNEYNLAKYWPHTSAH